MPCVCIHVMSLAKILELLPLMAMQSSPAFTDQFENVTSREFHVSVPSVFTVNHVLLLIDDMKIFDMVTFCE